MPPFGKHPETLVRQDDPFNAGPPPARLAAAEITPVEDFFVRNHGGVPEVDPASYRLRIEGEVERPLEVCVKYLDYSGQQQEQTFSELGSHCVQHEIDHLNGVLFIDHLSSLKRNMLMKRYKKQQDAEAL